MPLFKDVSWGDIGALGLPGGPEYNLYKQFSKNKGYQTKGLTQDPLTADKVKLAEPLKGTFQGYGQKAQSSLSKALGAAGEQGATSAAASGRSYGGYTGQELGRQGMESSQNIDNSLAAVLGGASLEDVKKQREYEQNVNLAKEIGALMKPSDFEQLVKAMNGTAEVGGQGLSLYQALNQNKAPSYSKNPEYGISSPSNYGYSYPDIPDFGYGPQYNDGPRRRY